MLELILHMALALANPMEVVTKALPRSTATYYKPSLQGKLMAGGKPYVRQAYSCAYNKWAIGTLVKITNLETGMFVFLRITDRKASNRGIDLSEVAFSALGLSKEKGWGYVSIKRVKETTERDK